MQKIGTDTIADLFFKISWDSPGVRHTDAYAGHQVNFWRDLIPRRILEELAGKRTGDKIQIKVPANELLDTAYSREVTSIPRRQLRSQGIYGTIAQPRRGRFYPKGWLKNIPGIFAANVTPFRCVQVSDGHLDIDLGHPLSTKDIDLSVTVIKVDSKPEERGGSLRSWGEIITEAVGMQARWKAQPTDFFSDAPFERRDGTADTIFYAEPRLVQHIDDTARDWVRRIHSKFVRKGATVLDLMSSWQTHLPENVRPARLIGLGLNDFELQHNMMLDTYKVHDLNADPALPFENQSFDTVLCSLSVEYLIHPWKVFSEVARVLKVGGTFAVTFSNRWFEPKTIRLWPELHEFERMGMILEYFRLDHRYDDLHTYSVRGMARPENDKYFGKIPCADPVYAVWGKRKNDDCW